MLNQPALRAHGRLMAQIADYVLTRTEWVKSSSRGLTLAFGYLIILRGGELTSGSCFAFQFAARSDFSSGLAAVISNHLTCVWPLETLGQILS